MVKRARQAVWYGQDTYPFWDSPPQPWNGNNTIYLTGFLRGLEIIYIKHLAQCSAITGLQRIVTTTMSQVHVFSAVLWMSTWYGWNSISTCSLVSSSRDDKWAHFTARETAIGSLALSEKLLGLVSIQSAVSGSASPLPAPMGLSWDIHTQDMAQRPFHPNADGKWCLALVKALRDVMSKRPRRHWLRRLYQHSGLQPA